MGKSRPPKVNRYNMHFKATSVRLSYLVLRISHPARTIAANRPIPQGCYNSRLFRIQQ